MSNAGKYSLKLHAYVVGCGGKVGTQSACMIAALEPWRLVLIQWGDVLVQLWHNTHLLCYVAGIGDIISVWLKRMSCVNCREGKIKQKHIREGNVMKNGGWVRNYI